jgi:prepilin-type N-terminal cleavage/methylation domain-containing protein
MKKVFKIHPSFSAESGHTGTGSGAKAIRSQKGFTLIEIVVTLVLVGILAALGGMGIVQAVKGYITVKENSVITQKAQLAMSRMTREIVEMIRITSPGANATVLPLATPTGEKIIGLDNGAVKMAFNSASLPNGDILIDDVENLTFTYYQGATESSTWAVGNDRALSGVKVSLEIRHPQGQTLTYGGPLIYPRNNGNMGGEVLSGVSSGDIDTSWGDIKRCFVATAAYGDAGHPMVQVLRDFRDQYLLKFSAGKWFVQKYYQYGPSAAGLIHNRPAAMFLARCLLAPFIGFAFCLMYAPLAMIFIFFVSMILTAAAFSFYRRDLKWNPAVFRSRGSILIGLIVTMVIVAVLAAAMLPMFSSSYMNQVYADQGRKAYFLAESGFTYAQHQFFEANTEAAKEAVIADMNGKTYTFTNGNSFKFDIYPYWFKTRATSAGATALVTDSLAQPPASSLPAGNIRVGTAAGGYKYYSYTSATAGSMTFNGLSPAIATALGAGSDVQLVALSNNSGNAVGNGGNIVISNGAGAFPEFNGTFTFDPTPSGIPGGTVFRYERRTGNVLHNVTLSDPRRTWINFTVSNGTKVVLEKFIIVHSTGTIGSATRKVTYYVPLGWMAGGEFRKVEHLDKDMTHFFTASDKSIGTHTVSGGRMAVSSVVDPYAIRTSTGFGAWIAGIFKSFLSGIGIWPQAGYWGVVGFDWSNTNVNLAQSWSDTHGSLSYDIQVKMQNTLPYFMTGIGFKLRSNNNESDAYGYGVSIIRQRQTACANTFLGTCGFDIWSSNWGSTIPGYCLETSGASPINDGINADLRPLTHYSGEEQIWCNRWAGIVVGAAQYARYSDPAIVLWQRNGPANSTGNFKLLAYRTIQPADGLTYCHSGAASCTGSDLRLKPWVTLMVRVIEGYELPFTSGRVDSFGRHFKYGDTIMNQTGSKTARIIGTPVMSAVWGATGSSVGAGRLMLTNVIGGGFSSGEQLYIVGGDGSAYATTSGPQAVAKSNYIMVYYSDVASGSGDTVQANNTRLGNPVYTTQLKANWPPDDWTDRAAENDYMTLVKWHYITPGTNQVSASASWTLGNGWSASGSNLNRIKSLGPSIGPSLSSGWSLGSRWRYSGGLHKDGSIFYASSSSSYPLITTAGTQYDVNITTARTWWSAGSASYTFGGVSGGGISNGSYGPTTFTAGSSSTAIVVTGSGDWDGTITSFTTRPHVPVGITTVPLMNPLTAGTTFAASITITGLDSGESVYYTIGDYTSPTYTANGTYPVTSTLPWNAGNAGQMVFHSSTGVSHVFSVSNISVVPSVINGTLVTSPDTQGNVASYVPAHGSTDFYQAVVKTGALVSPAWNSSATYQTFLDGGGDSIALVTSSYAPNRGATTFYDDFAIQMDMKAGVGFMPPIQQ